jgi:dipicolinate synthase subunit A
MGARVTLSARKESDRAMIRALGYDAMDPAEQGYRLIAFRVIFNTVPEMIFPKDILQYSREDCLKIDLASLHGMDGDDVIVAKGLPNQEAPESSGNLIAKTVLRLRGVPQ